jgi:hypothetical protein
MKFTAVGWSEVMTNCVDCRWDTINLGEWYMVRDDVWEQACRREPKPAYLCIGCLEERLSRTLTPDDFIDAPVNDPTDKRSSSRLRARLTRR